MPTKEEISENDARISAELVSTKLKDAEERLAIATAEQEAALLVRDETYLDDAKKNKAWKKLVSMKGRRR